MKTYAIISLLIITVATIYAADPDRAENGVKYDRLAREADYLRIAFGAKIGDPLYDPALDLDKSGIIDGVDLALLAGTSDLKTRLGDSTGKECCHHDQAFVPGEILVKFRDRVSLPERQTIVQTQRGMITATSKYSRVMRVSLPEGLSVEAAIKQYTAEAGVEYVEPNYYRYPQWRPNDRYYKYQWHFDLINMEKAWDVTRGDPNVLVAVLDTGLAYADATRDEHLKCCTSKVYSGRISYCKGTDWDGVQIYEAFDFFYGDPYPWDDHGHGTHVTGTIMQSSDNNKGCAGIAPQCRLMPLKISDTCGCSNDFVMSDAIYHAVNGGAAVINISFGGPGASATLHNACKDAYNRGIWIVAAAGNEAESPSWNGGVYFPAGYPETLAIGAVNLKKERAAYSNYGESSYGVGIDFAAPGGDDNDYNEDDYPDSVLQESFPSPSVVGNTLKLYTCGEFAFYFFSGTSMAAPHVTGVIALLISAGITDRDEIYSVLKQTATDLGADGKDEYFGHGLIDAGKVLSYAKYGWGINS